jgi:hypothetical protein
MVSTCFVISEDHCLDVSMITGCSVYGTRYLFPSGTWLGWNLKMSMTLFFHIPYHLLFMHLWELCMLRSFINEPIVNCMDQAPLKCKSEILILEFTCFSTNC